MITESKLFDPQTLHELRRIEFRTKRLIDADLLGRYRSAFRGTGLVFSDLREYMPGDDTRHIHWKVTARTGKTFVKSFDEDRQLRILIAVDISNSTTVGTMKSKHQKALEFSALVSMLGYQSQDAVGLCLFSDSVEEYYPPKRTRSQFKLLTGSLVKRRELRRETNIGNAIRFVLQNQRRSSVVFLVSDFISSPFEDELVGLSYKHDVVGVHLRDKIDTEIPNVGMVEFTDAETGERYLIDSSAAKYRSQVFKAYQEKTSALKNIFERCGADFITIDDNIVKPLADLMRTRMRRH